MGSGGRGGSAQRGGSPSILACATPNSSVMKPLEALAAVPPGNGECRVGEVSGFGRETVARRGRGGN